MPSFVRLQYPTRLFDMKKRRFKTDIRETTRYAILSHRWGPDELKFEELSQVKYPNLTSNAKFNKFCEVAATQYSCRYVWTDSGCIDQNDEVELDASIRSMYWWYKNAYVCIVYLFDVSGLVELERSAWFTRGWTLQELLAPQRMAFFDMNWQPLSERPFDIQRDSDSISRIIEGSAAPDELAFHSTVVSAAGIKDLSHLLSHVPSCDNVDLVLDWASSRCTTRAEDRAYSLVSLLRVCLPPDYGEGGDRAMERLKEACESVPKFSDELEMEHILSPRIAVVTRDLSRLCQVHRERGGRPLLVNLITDGINDEELVIETYVLYGATPLPSTDLLVVTAENSDFGDPSALMLRHMATGEVIPSVFELCAECSRARRRKNKRKPHYVHG